LNIDRGTLQRWIREYKDQHDEAFPGNGRMSPERKKRWQLEAEVKRLKMNGEILKNGRPTRQ